VPRVLTLGHGLCPESTISGGITAHSCCSFNFLAIRESDCTGTQIESVQGRCEFRRIAERCNVWNVDAFLIRHCRAQNGRP
jgi:hypothetical protein